MFRLSFFIVAFIIVGGSEAISVLNLSEYDVIHVVDNHNSCSRKDIERWANVFVNCFVNRKNLFKTRRDLINIVARLLDRSKSCIKFSTLACRPDYDGFLNIMGEVIEMIKGYCNMHVERLTRAGIITYAERADKIIDLNCVENSLTKDTYATCFSSVISAYEQLGENETYDLIYQKEVEMAILCTNTAKRQCSESSKIDLNKIVRYILGVKQPEKEYIEDDHTPSELPRLTEPPKPQSELRKTGKGNIDDHSVTPKFPDSTRHSESAEVSETEKEKLESNLKKTKSSESQDFREGKNDDDQEYHDHAKSLKFTETFILNEQTTALNQVKSEKENIKNDPEISEDLELTETSILSENSKITNFPKALESVKSSTFLNARKEDDVHQFTESLQPLKTTEFPKVDNLPNSTHFDDSKDIDVAEAGKDIVIDILNAKEKSAGQTESPKPMEQFKTSTHLNTGKNDYDLQFTESLEPLKVTVFPKYEDRTNSTDFDASKDHVVTEAGKDIMTEPTKMDFEEKFISSTKLPKLIDFPKSTESTKHPKSVDIAITTTSPKPLISTDHPKTTTSAKPPKPTELSKTTTFTKPSKPAEGPRTSMSTKPPKPTEGPETTTSTKLPKPTERSRTAASEKPPKPTERQRTTTSTKRPMPIVSSRIPPKRTERPKTTTTARPRTSSRVVHSRSRDDTIRPTEAPRPWYDFIVRPFVSLWRTIKSWFGW